MGKEEGLRVPPLYVAHPGEAQDICTEIGVASAPALIHQLPVKRLNKSLPLLLLLPLLPSCSLSP